MNPGTPKARETKRPPEAPRDVAELVKCLGTDGLLRLIEARGGVRVHVPKAANIKGSILLPILGEEALGRLADEFGGLLISVPLCREWRIRMMLHEGGRSHAEIALATGATCKWVQRLSRLDWTPMPSNHNGARKLRRGASVQHDLADAAGMLAGLA